MATEKNLWQLMTRQDNIFYTIKQFTGSKIERIRQQKIKKIIPRIKLILKAFIELRDYDFSWTIFSDWIHLINTIPMWWIESILNFNICDTDEFPEMRKLSHDCVANLDRPWFSNNSTWAQNPKFLANYLNSYLCRTRRNPTIVSFRD